MTQPASCKDLEIRLFATLRQHRGKKLAVPFRPGMTAADVLGAIGIPGQDVSILLVNGRDASPDRMLEEGDILSLFPPVGGG